MESLAPAFEHADLLPLRAEYRLATAIARAHAALGEERLDAAELHLADADALAEHVNRGYDVLRIKVLRGVIGAKRGEPGAGELLREAHELASITGHQRMTVDAHPHAERLLAQARAAAPSPPTSVRSRAARSPILTSKESEVLDLLGKGLPNKAIARALDVSGETVKWHLKNLYVKLSAGSRRHAVERARMLGLVA
jgi:LuxR family maltose regulon positive regulatory protein